MRLKAATVRAYLETRAKRERMRALYAAGWTPRQIADDAERTTNTVIAALAPFHRERDAQTMARLREIAAVVSLFDVAPKI